MKNWKDEIRNYLQGIRKQNMFEKFGTIDMSRGRYVKEHSILNPFLVKFLIQHLRLNVSASSIGRFLYHECRDLLVPSGFWTSKRGRTLFWYEWT